MKKVYYNSQPDAICYMPLPGGDAADVWLRKNITPPETDKEDSCWTADEVYFRTALSMEDVQANFDTLFERDGLLTDPELPPEERIAALEEQNQMLTDCILELSAKIYE